MEPRIADELEYVASVSAATALAALPEPLARWFQDRFGQPTASQCLAWPVLAQGRHLLLSAPTGTGKTLAAFVPILGSLLQAPPVPGRLRCLYVAPLKALCNDVARSLESHLHDLAGYLPHDTPLPRILVRTGDSSTAERRRLSEEPPELLLTTPESLAVLLSQPQLHSLFAELRWVVVDEVHALAPNKRGADLALSLERLTALAVTEPQRIGLSATALPLPRTARFLVGSGRPCAIARVDEETRLRLTVEPLVGRGFLASLVERLIPELAAHRAILVFTNTRSLAERLAWALRQRLPDYDDLIAVHHSALAAERRRAVEQRFKEGELRVMVSSTSLELGIDVGSVDLVVLVHPPGDVVRLLQRVGRAGHGPRRVKRGLVLTATAAELLEATVTAAAGQAGQCEPLAVPAYPLDVLCQQLAGMAAGGVWSADDAYELVCRAAPYHELPRRDFDDCLAYLMGQDADGASWLPPRLLGTTDAFTIQDEPTARLIRRNLGSIVAEEGVEVRLDDPESGPLIGSVEEMFAERLQPGDRFLLDGRCLEFRHRDGAGVWVQEVIGRPRVPRWASDGWPLSAALARRLYVLRVRAAEALREGVTALEELLRREYGLEGAAVAQLADYFQRQESISEIPDTRSLLIEAVADGYATTYYLHVPLNRLACDALSRVAAYRLAHPCAANARPVSCVALVADLGLSLQVRGDLGTEPAAVVRQLLDADDFDADLDATLAEGDTLRHRFERVARTGLMLLRNPLGRRRRVGGHDWGERRLFEQVRARAVDFVLLRQVAREVRSDLCDAATARNYLAELPRLTVRCRWLTQPSPFAESWTQLELAAVEQVDTVAGSLQRLHATLTGRDDARPE